jgi:hypothetical protein
VDRTIRIGASWEERRESTKLKKRWDLWGKGHVGDFETSVLY